MFITCLLQVTVGDVQNRFFKFLFGFGSVFEKKLPIRSGMSVVWFGMKKCGSVQMLELFTTYIIAE